MKKCYINTYITFVCPCYLLYKYFLCHNFHRLSIKNGVPYYLNIWNASRRHTEDQDNIIINFLSAIWILGLCVPYMYPFSMDMPIYVIYVYVYCNVQHVVTRVSRLTAIIRQLNVNCHVFLFLAGRVRWFFTMVTFWD